MIHLKKICDLCDDAVVSVQVPSLWHNVSGPFHCNACRAKMGDKEAQKRQAASQKAVKNLIRENRGRNAA
jgi:hypothetical protein